MSKIDESISSLLNENIILSWFKLHEDDIVGRPGNPYLCPLAEYVRSREGADSVVYVSGGTISISYPRGDSRDFTIRIDLPPRIKQFILGVDRINADEVTGRDCLDVL